MMLERHMFTEPGLAGWVVAGLVLLAARPAALVLPMLKSALGWRERIALAWFGPKGFASVLFALMVEHSRRAEAKRIFDVAALTVTASMVLHSSSSVPFANWLSGGRKSTP
jgi:NhaP-type Na+/H+ or K+/H+ antiporter